VSNEYHDNFKQGETWSLVVTLTDADGAALVPSALTFRLWDWAGNELTKSLGSGIALGGTDGNVATITIPTTDSAGLAARLHRHELMATKGGALSRQIHGTIGVLA
jgi:hypothetical protein